MSVILESLPGDSIYCIETFFARPIGSDPHQEPLHEIQVGDRASYVGSREDEHFKDHSAHWQVIFETSDGQRYSAVDALFVTEDCWARLDLFFRKRFLTAQSPSNGSACSTAPAAN